MVASTGPEMEQEQDTTTWVIVACGIYIYWLCCRRPCFTIHPSLNPPSMYTCVCVKLCRMFESAPTSSGFLEVRREPGLSLQMILLPSFALEWQQLVARPGPGLAQWLT